MIATSARTGGRSALGGLAQGGLGALVELRGHEYDLRLVASGQDHALLKQAHPRDHVGQVCAGIGDAHLVFQRLTHKASVHEHPTNMHVRRKCECVLLYSSGMTNDLVRHCPIRQLVHDAAMADLLTDEERQGRRSTGPYVYRFYAADREALYIGVTSGTALRWADHRRSSEWWPLAEYVAVSFYGTYEAAMVAEAAAIKAERPCFNRQWLKPRRHMEMHFEDGAQAIAAELHKIASPEFVSELARLLASPERFPQPLPPPVPDFAGC